MNYDMIYDVTIGIAVLYLYFISWNFTTDNPIGIIVFKLIPFGLASTMLLITLMRLGFIIQV